MLAIAVLANPGSAWAATFTVNSTTDAVDNNIGNGVCLTAGGVCTLRAAIQEANDSAAADTIVLIAGTYTLARGSGDDSATNGDLDITESVTINGAGARTTIVSGGTGADADRVFDISGNSTVWIGNLTVTNGDAKGKDGGGFLVDSGSSLTLADVTVSSNRAKNGGGIGNNGMLTLTRVTVSNNQATSGAGGGIQSAGAGPTNSLTNVTISGNSATGDAGGAEMDRGVLLNVTITGNTTGGSGSGLKKRGGQPHTHQNTLISGNSGATQCDGSPTSLGNNLSGDTSCSYVAAGDLQSTNPLLGALADNGGPTNTHALGSGSPAIDAGNNVGAPATDQRGVSRPLGAAVDIGAYEAATFSLTGSVFEDNAGDALLDGAIGGANNPGVASVAVAFYLDNGDGTPGAGDTLVGGSPVTTGAGGSYTKSGFAPGSYWVVVDSRTLASSQDPAEPVANLWAEQTYGAAAARCSNGAGGTATLGSAGACYGGQRGAQSDDPASLATAEHVTGVTVATANVTGIDFGFSFKVVTTARDGDDDGAAANRWVQGSLRQFLQNSNAIGVADAMRFVPAVATNASGSGGTWWQVALTGAALPIISDAGTTVDGTAYCAWTTGTQGCAALTQVRDPNPGTSGNPDFAGKSVGTGADGIEGTADDPQLPNYDRPELEVNGNDLGVILEVGASTATIRRLAVINYDSLASGYAILVSGGTGSLVTENFLGPRADGIDPGAGLRLGYAVNITAGTADITKCFVGYTEGGGIFTANATLIQENDIYRNGISRAIGDGVSIEDSTGQAITVRRNRIDRSAGYGFEGWRVPGPYAVENNTVSRSGEGGGVETGGLRVFGAGSTIRSNVVTSSAGAGIAVVQRSAPGSNLRNRITKNAIYGNGSISIDLDVTNTGAGNPNGDGVTPNDGATDPNLPNIAMDYPVITSASLKASILNVVGYVGTAATKVAGVHTIELFKAANDGNNNGPIVQGDGLSVPHGEARWFLNACTSAADGTFDCNVAVPGAVPFAVGDPVAGTATNATGSTSEVGANVAVIAAPVPAIVKRAILLDGTPLADGVTVPRGTRIKFLLYINNTVGAIADVSLVDTLDPGFAYIASSIRTSNTVAACAALACTPAEEAAIFAAANAGVVGSDAIDADTVSFTGGVVRAGNQAVANAQLDIAAVKVYALVFTVRVQ